VAIYAAARLASTITERQLTELFANLRAIKDWASLEQRLATALHRNATAANVRDGYARQSTGFAVAAKGGDPGDPAGMMGVARAEFAAMKDPIDEHTRAAAAALLQAVVSLQTLRSRLDLIDHLSSDEELEPLPGCAVMARVNVFEPVHRTGDVGGRLKRPVALGKWAYEFVLNTGQLPSREQTRAHADGRRVRVKA
jgi:hypothetical protein